MVSGQRGWSAMTRCGPKRTSTDESSNARVTRKRLRHLPAEQPGEPAARLGTGGGTFTGSPCNMAAGPADAARPGPPRPPPHRPAPRTRLQPRLPAAERVAVRAEQVDHPPLHPVLQRPLGPARSTGPPARSPSPGSGTPPRSARRRPRVVQQFRRTAPRGRSISRTPRGRSSAATTAARPGTGRAASPPAGTCRGRRR